MRASLRLLLTHRLLWSFIGVTALSCLVWMLGPFWSWGESRPLEPVLPRQLTVSALYFLWILFQLIPSLYRAWFNSRLLTQLQLSGNDDPAERQMTEERLNQRFSEAAMQLKRTQFGRRHSGNLLSRFNANYLYQLPWYLVMGAPGAGKTTALFNAGLDFPLTDTLGKMRSAASGEPATVTGGLLTARC